MGVNNKIRPYPWVGGKLRMADIIKCSKPVYYTNYYELFGGSASVLLNQARPKGREVLNDYDEDIVNLLRQIQDSQSFVEQLVKTSYNEKLFQNAIYNKKRNYEGFSDAERAQEVFIEISQSFNASRKSFRKMPGEYTETYQQINKKNLYKVRERLQGVEITNEDAIEYVAKIQDQQAFIYLDPPYVKALRGQKDIYVKEMDNPDQEKLLNNIKDSPAQIMLSGYRAEEGEDLYDTYLSKGKNTHWQCYCLGDFTKSCQTKKTRDYGKEFIWINYKLPDPAKYVISQKDYMIRRDSYV